MIKGPMTGKSAMLSLEHFAAKGGSEPKGNLPK
jgi:hypothetical protein